MATKFTDAITKRFLSKVIEAVPMYVGVGIHFISFLSLGDAALRFLNVGVSIAQGGEFVV